MSGGSWVIDTPPAHPRCYVIPNPESDDSPQSRCNGPCETGRTILDYPVCEACYLAVSLDS